MRIWHRLLSTSEQRRQWDSEKKDKLALLHEIEKAHMDWMTAHHRLDYVLDKDQIDYAVFALEAAEKRFEMLIKQAKGMNLTAVDIPRVKFAVEISAAKGRADIFQGQVMESV
jgi:hypothetical protein